VRGKSQQKTEEEREKSTGTDVEKLNLTSDCLTKSQAALSEIALEAAEAVDKSVTGSMDEGRGQTVDLTSLLLRHLSGLFVL
jgi:tRNA(Met) C34 N-acetyltransferase TmcA